MFYHHTYGQPNSTLRREITDCFTAGDDLLTAFTFQVPTLWSPDLPYQKKIFLQTWNKNVNCTVIKHQKERPCTNKCLGLGLSSQQKRPDVHEKSSCTKKAPFFSKKISGKAGSSITTVNLQAPTNLEPPKLVAVWLSFIELFTNDGISKQLHSPCAFVSDGYRPIHVVANLACPATGLCSSKMLFYCSLLRHAHHQVVEIDHFSHRKGPQQTVWAMTSDTCWAPFKGKASLELVHSHSKISKG